MSEVILTEEQYTQALLELALKDLQTVDDCREVPGDT